MASATAPFFYFVSSNSRYFDFFIVTAISR
jgi:hypothetical protein